jgi:hypothetical protein
VATFVPSQPPFITAIAEIVGCYLPQLWLFEGCDRKTGQVKWTGTGVDLIFGSNSRSTKRRPDLSQRERRSA